MGWEACSVPGAWSYLRDSGSSRLLQGGPGVRARSATRLLGSACFLTPCTPGLSRVCPLPTLWAPGHPAGAPRWSLWAVEKPTVEPLPGTRETKEMKKHARLMQLGKDKLQECVSSDAA